MPNRSSKPPRDANQLARFIVDQATGQGEASAADPSMPFKNAAAVELGRLGGLKGGKARAKALSKAERSKIARRAAKARWNKR